MQNFETLISQALAEGDTIDTIIKQITDALKEKEVETNAKANAKVETKANARVEAKTKVKAKESAAMPADSNFWELTQEEEVIGASAWLVAVMAYKIIQNPKVLKDILGLFDSAKDSFKDLKDAFGDIDQKFKADNKSKDNWGRPDRENQLNKADEDSVYAFLRNLY